MEISELQKMVHALACEKGWWHGDRTNPLELHMLMVSEIAEATEEARKGMPHVYQKADNEKGYRTPGTTLSWDPVIKPEGELIELADCVIRIMDYFASKGWDLESAILLKHEFNKTRPYRHGGKKF